ncbi:hypothetical protein BH11GEM2_BH11GEM2_24000 [soil metagenome]
MVPGENIMAGMAVGMKPARSRPSSDIKHSSAIWTSPASGLMPRRRTMFAPGRARAALVSSG